MGATVPVMGGDLQETTELNLFFHRLDAVDPSHPPPRPSSDASPIAGSSPTPRPPPALLHHKRCCQSRRCPGMSAGPKSLSAKLLKGCAAQLWNIFQHFPADGKMVVPALWKTTCLVPVPKKQASKDSL